MLLSHRIDSNTKPVIQHEPRKMKKSTTCLMKKHFQNFSRQFFCSQNFLAYFFEKYSVLHLFLGMRQNCAGTSHELIDIVVQVISVLNKSQSLQKNRKKSRQNSCGKNRNVSAKNQNNQYMFFDRSDGIGTPLGTHEPRKLEKSTTCPLENHFPPIFPQQKNFGKRKIYGIVN